MCIRDRYLVFKNHSYFVGPLASTHNRLLPAPLKLRPYGSLRTNMLIIIIIIIIMIREGKEKGVRLVPFSICQCPSSWLQLATRLAPCGLGGWFKGGKECPSQKHGLDLPLIKIHLRSTMMDDWFSSLMILTSERHS